MNANTQVVRNRNRYCFILRVDTFRSEVMFLNRRMVACDVTPFDYIHLN